MPEAPRDPMRAAQANMRPPALRRFYKRVERRRGRGRRLRAQLDGRGARTPGKRPLVAPTRAVAELIAAEWAAQGETIEPMSMPATRLANSAIDGVADALAATRAAIAGYAAADLVCYRADGARGARRAAGRGVRSGARLGARARSARVSSRPSASPMSPSRRRRSPRRARRSRSTPTPSPSRRCT